MPNSLFENTPNQKIKYLLEVEHVRKEFPGVLALDDASLRLKPGSVHAVVGENGAGKSTLMNIISCIYQPDQGVLRLRGEEIHLNSPLDALKNGIAMIHQELNLMPSMTVAENIWIGREPMTRFRFIDHRKLHSRTSDLFHRLNIDLDPEIEVRALTVANRQLVEIAKAVSYNSDILIMDEPTSALTERDAERLFHIIRTLKAEGKGIIYITHKMGELFEIADEVSVFRDGRYLGTHDTKDVTRDDIFRMMVGREITQMFPKQSAAIGDVVLAVKDLGLHGIFTDISFELRAGEILGFAGLVGSGRSNIAEALFGITPASSGSISINGKAVIVDTPAKAMANGMAFLTEDRKETGCFLILDVLENTQIAVLNNDYVTNGFVAQSALTNNCEQISQALRVKTPTMQETMLNLSGGNQQKVLIARWLLTKPKILILDEPTRGIDVGAKAEIHRLISNLVAEGMAVIMISSEMPEILGMSDRIIVLHEGRITGFLNRDEADQVKIMELASQ